MSDPAADLNPDLVREDFLCLTSDLRVSLDRVQTQPSDTATISHILTIGRSLSGIATRARAAHLVRCTELLERMASVGRAQLRAKPGDSATIFADLPDAVGYLEQLLEGWLDGWDAERQEDLYRTLSALFPTNVAPVAVITPGRSNASEQAPAAETNALLDAGGDDSLLNIDESEIDPELLEVFGIEASEILTACEQLLLKLDGQAGDREVLSSLFRQFHTLKGAAAAVGLEAAAAYVHEGESLLEAAANSEATLTGQPLVDFLFRLVDSVAGLVNRARGIEDHAHHIIPNIQHEIARLQRSNSSTSTVPSTSSGATSDTTSKSDASNKRVESNRLSTLVGEASELALTGSDLEEKLHSLRRLQQKLGSGDAADELAQLIATLEQKTQHVSKLASGLQQQITSLRLVPFDTIFRRLLRSVRDAARHEGKRAELQLNGGEVVADRTVVEALYGPLLHLVRNAVSHGIETPAKREAAGKPASGTVRITAESANDGAVTVTVTDDGAGLDFEAILAKARVKRLIAATATPSRDELLPLIFHPGFSTKDEVTQVAGRGVGMDVVAREIANLNGRIAIDSEPGAGTTIRLDLPVPGDETLVALVPAGARAPADSSALNAGSA
ncbi:MAG TPA: ATP-binding protein [Candidatus Kryptonia bacterium]|nr:ATP-binding protein [Candidatus Kryptonia bacterium]